MCTALSKSEFHYDWHSFGRIILPFQVCIACNTVILFVWETNKTHLCCKKYIQTLLCSCLFGDSMYKCIVADNFSSCSLCTSDTCFLSGDRHLMWETLRKTKCWSCPRLLCHSPWMKSDPKPKLLYVTVSKWHFNFLGGKKKKKN
jgi:hypothetical protein